MCKYEISLLFIQAERTLNRALRRSRLFSRPVFAGESRRREKGVYYLLGFLTGMGAGKPADLTEVLRTGPCAIDSKLSISQ